MKAILFGIGGVIVLVPIAVALHFGIVVGIIQGIGLGMMAIALEIGE